MSTQKRALLIAMIGPGLQALGLLVEVGHVLTGHLDVPLGARHIVFEPGFLIIFVGFVVTVVAVPVALDVAGAREDELEIPEFGPPEPEVREAYDSGGRA